MHTNFSGKAEAAIKALDNGSDFVYIHLEAPDEAGHRCETENKVKAIELIDEKIVSPVVSHLENSGEEFAILIMPDHPTPLAIKTHTSDPVPYIIYKSTQPKENSPRRYTEDDASKTGIYVKNGYTLIEKLFN